MSKEVNDYYTKYFKDWLFLRYIDVKTALELINQKSDMEIRNILDTSPEELEEVLIKCQILPDDKLSCELRGGAKLTQADKEFYAIVRKHKCLNDISMQWQSSTHVLKINAKIIVGKILLGLYPNLKEISFNFDKILIS